MSFDISNIPTSVLCRIPHKTFVPRLIPNGQVMSENKIFERNNLKIYKKKVAKGQQHQHGLTD